MMVTCAEGLRELAFRESDGIQVTLLWRPGTDKVTVAVLDTERGETFEVPVPPWLRALHVFDHPYAYASPWHVERCWSTAEEA